MKNLLSPGKRKVFADSLPLGRGLCFYRLSEYFVRINVRLEKTLCIQKKRDRKNASNPS
jgi:hypothetical protein